jgi:KilA-N domain
MDSLYTNMATALTSALCGTDKEYIFSGIPVHVRGVDGYVNISAMAAAANKNATQYFRTKRATKFLTELEQALQMQLVMKVATNRGYEIWVHPMVLLGFSTWISGLFGSYISAWFLELQLGKQRVDELLANC